ncbi:WbqC family protein [Anianabacter salinae]|uniref:WbqC family protein n=1 Tax=Anianabacter salinae TaxID=2851023 RepID=UPI00225E44E9|nr:WbqC family protein [Anianabacter salinae]MBV0914154.1 WbqC family protein [Anianabacter salinae]
MRVSIHQPAYLPWLGYFDRIARSDVFVFLDTVQFEKNSFTNRNRIKTPNGPLMLTLPVKQRGHMSSTLQQLEIDSRQPWRRKHLASIEANYRKSPRFAAHWPRLQALYPEDALNFSDFCFDQLCFWCAELGITTELKRATDLGVTGEKSELVENICKSLGATCYISGPFGRDYLNIDKFDHQNIKVEIQNFAHPVYPQLHGDFAAAMGIVDYWLNDGRVWARTEWAAP